MPNRERNVGINIRVTPEEKKKIMRYAKRCRLTTSEYIRKVSVKDEPKVFIPKSCQICPSGTFSESGASFMTWTRTDWQKLILFQRIS